MELPMDVAAHLQGFAAIGDVLVTLLRPGSPSQEHHSSWRPTLQLL
jgi:hypothetical protein